MEKRHRSSKEKKALVSRNKKMLKDLVESNQLQNKILEENKFEIVFKKSQGNWDIVYLSIRNFLRGLGEPGLSPNTC